MWGDQLGIQMRDGGGLVRVEALERKKNEAKKQKKMSNSCSLK